MTNEELLKRAYAVGFEFEKKYHGCAQCTIGALYEIFPELKNKDIFRAASGLGAGVGLTGKGHCGGLSGAVMVLSQLYGRELEEIDDPEKKRYVAFQLGQRLVQKFLDEYGTVICQEIHRKLMGRDFDLWDQKDKQSFEHGGAHDRICPSLIGNAVEWAAQLILAERATPHSKKKPKGGPPRVPLVPHRDYDTKSDQAVGISRTSSKPRNLSSSVSKHKAA